MMVWQIGKCQTVLGQHFIIVPLVTVVVYTFFYAGRYFIANAVRNNFPTLDELIGYYSKHVYGLCVNLKEPCIQPVKKAMNHGLLIIDQWEIDRSSLTFVTKIGSGKFGEVWEGLWDDTIRRIPVAIKQLKPGSS